MKKSKKKEKVYYNKQCSITLPSGQRVTLTLKHTTETINVPVRYQVGARTVDLPDHDMRQQEWELLKGVVVAARGRMENGQVVIPKMRKLRVNGQIVTHPIKVPGCYVRIVFEDKTSVEARSCCKPPDTFDSTTGFLHALKRITRMDDGVSLNKFVPTHVDEKKMIIVKGGKHVVDKKAKPKLTGADRVALRGLILRRGREAKVRRATERRPATETEKSSVLKTATG